MERTNIRPNETAFRSTAAGTASGMCVQQTVLACCTDVCCSRSTLGALRLAASVPNPPLVLQLHTCQMKPSPAALPAPYASPSRQPPPQLSRFRPRASANGVVSAGAGAPLAHRFHAYALKNNEVRWLTLAYSYRLLAQTTRHIDLLCYAYCIHISWIGLLCALFMGYCIHKRYSKYNGVRMFRKNILE